jgi:hypothetical protein
MNVNTAGTVKWFINLKMIRKIVLITLFLLIGAGAVVYTKKGFVVDFFSTGVKKSEEPLQIKKTKKKYSITSVSSTLLQIEDLAGSSGMSDEEFQQEIKNRGFQMDEQERVFVEVVGPTGGDPVSPELINKFGGQVGDSWRHRSEAWIPINQLSSFGAKLPKGYFVEPVYPPPLDFE